MVSKKSALATFKANTLAASIAVSVLLLSAILSDMVYRPWSLEGRRVEVHTLEDSVPGMDVGIAWNKKKELTPAEAAFCEFIRLTVVAGINS